MKKDRKRIIELMSVDFHQFLLKEQQANSAELAEELVFRFSTYGN
jgi:hypothetical protein